jgi:hypothetical protein
MGQVMAANMVLDYYVRLAREYPFEEVRSGMLGPSVVRREPVGVGLHHPVERPALRDHAEARPGARRRRDGRHQARPREPSTR